MNSLLYLILKIFDPQFQGEMQRNLQTIREEIELTSSADLQAATYRPEDYNEITQQ